MQPDDLISCPGVLALELAPGEQPARAWLDRAEAEELAMHIADDLRALLPGVEGARLAVVGAHFDAAELLRPGFPTFTTLDALAARLPGEVLALGAHQQRMPAQPLTPDPRLVGASLRLLPWSLLASPELAQTLGPAMEVELVGRGEVGVRTADFLMRTLGMQLEHARYLSRHDLMALTCVQYEHANLAPLWTLLEAALLAPEREQQVLSARGLAWRYVDGRACAQTPTEWLRAMPPAADDERPHALAGGIFELRQYVALLGVHHLPLAFQGGEYDADSGHLVEALAEADPALDTPRLYAHEAPGLGVVAVTVAQPQEDRFRLLAHAWPLAGRLDPLYQRLARRYGGDAAPVALGRIHLDADGQLDVPPPAVH